MTQPVETDLAPVARGMTADELSEMPEDLARRDLIDGDLYEMPSPTPEHQRIVVELVHRLRALGPDVGFEVFVAPLDLHVSDTTVVQPDVAIVRADHVEDYVGPYLNAVDVAIEVSSPSTRRHDLIRKRGVYERQGVPEFWFVDLDAERIEVHRLEGGSYGPPEIVVRGETATSDAIPGLTIAVNEVLREWDER